MKKDRVLIVDDDAGMHDLLEAILKDDYVVLKAHGGEEALRILTHHDVLVVLLDIRLPGICGIDTLGRILSHDPDIKCLMISAVHDVDTVVECMRKGAHDFIAKKFEHDTIRLKVRNAINLARLQKDYNRQVRKIMILEDQASHCHPPARCRTQYGRNEDRPSSLKHFDLKLSDWRNLLEGGSPERISPTNPIDPGWERENLTRQERKVLELILDGLANKEIAQALNIKLTTVKAHLKNSFQKLGVESRSQAAVHLLLRRFKSTAPTT